MNFKRFSTSDNQWYDVPYYQHKTATDTLTLPAVIYPNDTSITVGLKGNEEHTGTPTPDSPIMPEGCGERTENLAYGRINGVNISPEGIIARLGGYDVAIGHVESGVVYTVNSYVLAFYTNEPVLGSVSYDSTRIVETVGTPMTFTAPITGYVAFRLNSGEQAMLNTGSTALPYEPFGVKIPISSAGQTTPVYLGQVQTVRQIKKLVLTGEEAIYIYSGSASRIGFYIILSDMMSNARHNGFCTHFIPQITPNGSAINGVTFGAGNKYVFFTFSVDTATELNLTDIDSIKAYLAQQYANGTPVTAWYVLETAETGIINEPLMRIGDYADSLTTSVSCTAGENSFDVDTTVVPSEVTAGFSGWHPVSAAHERENGQWD